MCAIIWSHPCLATCLSKTGPAKNRAANPAAMGQPLPPCQEMPQPHTKAVQPVSHWQTGDTFPSPAVSPAPLHPESPANSPHCVLEARSGARSSCVAPALGCLGKQSAWFYCVCRNLSESPEQDVGWANLVCPVGCWHSGWVLEEGQDRTVPWPLYPCEGI